MATVHSKRLWRANVTSAAVKLFTASSGMTAIIKTLVYTNFGATPITVNLEVGPPVVGSSDYITQALVVPPTTTTIIGDLFIVMNPLDEAWGFLIGAGTGRYRAHGYYLTGVAP